MRPHPHLIRLLTLWAVAALAAAFFPQFQAAWTGLGVALLLVIVIDAVESYQHPKLTIARDVPHNLAIACWHGVTLRIRNVSRRHYELRVYDHHPTSFLTEGLPLKLSLAANAEVAAPYRVRPQRRGDAQFTRVEIEVLSAFRLWRRVYSFALPQTLKVYPNFAEVTKYALLATDNRLSQMGVKHRQRRGGGKEFHQLREYRDGDDIRAIDWKATSRQRKLIAREYQDERDQHVLFMVDCGRRMRAEDGDIKHFDQALNAMLLLSYVAVRQGDSVGFMTFAGEERWFAPQKGQKVVNAMLNRLYDLDVTLQSADYESAAKELLARQRKRALVIMITNVRDEDQAEIATAIRLLRTKHLVLLANLREAVLDQLLEDPVEDFESALGFAASSSYLEERRQAHRRLGRLGAIALDVTAGQLPIGVVNQYLDIKSSGRL